MTCAGMPKCPSVSTRRCGDLADRRPATRRRSRRGAAGATASGSGHWRRSASAKASAASRRRRRPRPAAAAAQRELLAVVGARRPARARGSYGQRRAARRRSPAPSETPSMRCGVLRCSSRGVRTAAPPASTDGRASRSQASMVGDLVELARRGCAAASRRRAPRASAWLRAARPAGGARPCASASPTAERRAGDQQHAGDEQGDDEHVDAHARR